MARGLGADMCCRRVWEISPQLLRERGVCGVLLDIDNTLTLHDSQHVPDEVRCWLDEMRSAELKLLLLSNNHPERVAPFAAALDLDFFAEAKKPLPGGYRRAAAQLELVPAQVAVIGDQIFTDALGGNLAGMQTILLEPIEPEKGFFFRCKRWLEKPLRRKMGKGRAQ